jgi:hypothetical protein
MSADKANEDNVTREQEEEEAEKLDTTTAANNPEDESCQDGSNHDDNEYVDGTIRRRVSDNDKDKVDEEQPLGNILGDGAQGIDAVPDLVNVPIVAGNQPPPQPPAAVAAPQAQQQAAGRGGGGGGGIMQNNAEKISIRIPIFRGDSQDSITVQQWVDTLTRAQTINNWSEKQAADMALKNL